MRPKSGTPRSSDIAGGSGEVELRFGDVTSETSLREDGFRGERFDVLLSCMASRTGAPEDAWTIDHDAHLTALQASQSAGISHFILLSAICVQKPRLAFQHAKLAFEEKLIGSGLTYSIVRPTAFFKSLSGQVERVRNGKSFLLFGDGTLTACKPISDDDLASYLADCVDDENLQNRILPIGGPGEPITPKQQGEELFALLGKEPKFTHVPVRFLDAIIATLNTIGWLVPAAKKKAELGRIGRYYATESMLVWDPEKERYDGPGTPSTGSKTLFEHYGELIRGQTSAERGDHAIF